MDDEGPNANLNKEENNGATGFTLLVVLGLFLVIQFMVFILFACKGWSVVFGYRPVTEEPDLPWRYQFPFLPSYDMAVNEMHATPQSIDAVQDNPRDDFREGVVGV
ncbi:uncharacterized protein LOC110044050 [Orbicella faveolata]|uniref:uncharacterized protein LOC110044050 n=1 Tax=Orbicella faveolata TaxID=48498 RepID=UPI0009E27C64|nr:uncharacterized protein LOC110044050 [Orbicella faveolata]